MPAPCCRACARLSSRAEVPRLVAAVLHERALRHRRRERDARFPPPSSARADEPLPTIARAPLKRAA